MPIKKNKYQFKNKGVSLIIVMGISFLILGVVMLILLSVSRSLEQSANIERSNQVFFMTESGIEAAFFHHNARGRGTEFIKIDDENFVKNSETNPQFLVHDEVGGATSWSVDGRAYPIVGLMREEQTIQIPLYWSEEVISGIDSPKNAPNKDGQSKNFQLNFYTGIPEYWGNSSDIVEKALYEKYGELAIPNNFEFGTFEPEVLIDWKVSRNFDDGTINETQTFLPNEGSGCDVANQYICDNKFLIDGGGIESASPVGGRLTPCTDECLIDLNTFMSDPDSSKFMLTFRPLLPFIEDADKRRKIPGIPFSITNTGLPPGETPIPKSTYDVIASVEIGDFYQKKELTVLEETSIGAFDYVIFD